MTFCLILVLKASLFDCIISHMHKYNTVQKTNKNQIFGKLEFYTTSVKDSSIFAILLTNILEYIYPKYDMKFQTLIISSIVTTLRGYKSVIATQSSIIG